jgi:hypothetical protein
MIVGPFHNPLRYQRVRWPSICKHTHKALEVIGRAFSNQTADAMAVVDNQLRVIDASVMPTVTSTNTNALNDH